MRLCDCVIDFVKVVPSNGGDSASHTTAKRLKVVCGSNIGLVAGDAWVKEASTKGKTVKGGTPFTFCEVRVMPHNTVKPNMGTQELAEALVRVLPFTASTDDRPVLACVKFEAKEGKLMLVSADGFALAVASLDYEGEGETLIHRLDLKDIPNALRRARRLTVSLKTGDENGLVLDTELIRYKWASQEGSYPNWSQLVPIDFKAVAHFDTIEARKAISSLKALADAKSLGVDVTLSNGQVILADADNNGQATINADIEGEGQIRVNSNYLLQALRACGGMASLQVKNSYSPMLFSSNGYQVVVMPMASSYSDQEQRKASAEARAQAEGQPAVDDTASQPGEVIAQAEAVASQAEAEGAKEPVAVA